MTTTDWAMARRFHSIPWRGGEPDQPLVGWRLEGVERGRLFNIDPTGGPQGASVFTRSGGLAAVVADLRDARSPAP